MGFIIITSPFLGICFIFASQLNWDSKDLRQPEKPPRRWKKKGQESEKVRSNEFLKIFVILGENKADMVPGALSIFCCKSKIDPNPVVIVMKHDSCHESTNQIFFLTREIFQPETVALCEPKKPEAFSET